MFLFASACCMLMGVSLVSCDEDEKIIPGVPAETVSGVTFADTDMIEGKIAGTLQWTAPESVANITTYIIYQSEDGKNKAAKLGEVPVGTNSFAIPEETDFSAYLLVVAANKTGESEAVASIQVEDAELAHGIYMLNSGKMGSNNASLSFYNMDTQKTDPDAFKRRNERGLGDTANDMIVYGSKMYIAVYNSNVIEVTDLKGKSIKQIKSSGDPLLPRFFTSYEGKVYVSLYDGYVGRLDTTSLEIDEKVKVGRNPEQLVVANRKLYVANSGGLDYSTPLGYDKTVSVVDVETFTESKKIEVVLNPVCLTTDNQGDVYLISIGDYGAIPNTFQRIDSNTDEVKTITETNATEFASTGDKLYILYSQYDANWNQKISFISYDAINEKVLSTNFITDGTTIAKPYKMGADPVTGSVYVTASDYKNNGDVYAFDAEGKKLFQYEAGLNPVKALYVKE